MKALKPAVIALLVSSCAVPQFAFDSPPQNPQFMIAIQDPYFSKIDAASFADAIVPYVQGSVNGEVRYADISFGQQLVTELLLNRPADFEFEKLTLTQFEGSCEKKGLQIFLPDLLCEVDYTVLLLTQDGRLNQLTGTIVHQADAWYVATAGCYQSVCPKVVNLMFEQVAPIATKLRQQVYSN